MFGQAGKGLAAAHEIGLVHRDFKPDNVLVGKDGRVCVTDFGLARSIAKDELERSFAGKLIADSPKSFLDSPLTQTGILMGAPGYMSSEQMLGQPADEKSDQYSFCVALWEALCGQRPIDGKSFADCRAAKRAVQMTEPTQQVVGSWFDVSADRGKWLPDGCF